MKLVVIALGVVLGIYISAEYPDVANQIFNTFLKFTNWIIESVKALIETR